MSKPFALPPERIERRLKEGLLELKKYEHIQGMNELIDLLVSFRYNEKLIELSKFDEERLYKYINRSKVKTVEIAKKELPGLISFSAREMSFIAFTSIYESIIYNFMAEFGRKLDENEFNSCLRSNLVEKLIYAQDNFINIGDVHLDRTYFKQLKKIKFSKEIKKFDKIIYKKYWSYITTEMLLDCSRCANIGISVNFLAGCYALSNGRNEVTHEDIINSWILTLNLFNMDLKPYI
ncbi:MAG: hypothetical protein MJ232_04820 [archaeon]|nr:hypothetical protein [archaeon]